MDSIRRAHMSEKLVSIIRIGKDFTVSELIHALMRRKNFIKDPRLVSDEELSVVLENMEEELKIDSQEMFQERNHPNGKA